MDADRIDYAKQSLEFMAMEYESAELVKEYIAELEAQVQALTLAETQARDEAKALRIRLMQARAWSWLWKRAAIVNRAGRWGWRWHNVRGWFAQVVADRATSGIPFVRQMRRALGLPQ